jgi:hypothetical protein
MLMETPAAEARDTASMFTAATSPRIPFWLKLAYTGFMAVLIPVYWLNYGPTDFLFFCQIALLLTLAGVWTESSFLISMAAVGLLIFQFFWIIDFGVELTGHQLTGMTHYMFDGRKTPFLRCLSLFHGWLPILLLFLVKRLRYDRRALVAWTILAWALCLACFFFMPAPDATLPNPKTPRNINYVFGLNRSQPQHWMVPGLYLAVWMLFQSVVFYWPTHLLLRKWFPKEGQGVVPPASRNKGAVPSIDTSPEGS